MRKISVLIILLCTLFLLSACGNTAGTTPPENTSGANTDVITSAPSDTSTVEPGGTESPVPDSSTPPATDSTPTSSAPGTDNSRPTNPPATSSNPTTPPTTSNPPPTTSNPPPTTSNPPTTSTPPPSKPTYTDADYQAIINEIRKYGEAKGFVWNDSFTFEEGHQYYGRPNLERDGYDGVINMLKYHCDLIATQYGACYFKVVKHIYQGQTEFVVLYD